MNIPSRPAVVLLSVLAGLLLAGAILWRYEIFRRQNFVENRRFDQKCLSSLNDLRLAQDAMNACFLKNSTKVIEVKNPASGVIKKASAPATGVPAPVASEPITLRGISWGDNPVAMINGKVYQTGDRINDCTLEEIRALSILLRGPDGKAIVIKLMEKNP